MAGASLEGEGGFGGNTRAAAERSQGNVKGVGGWLLAVANAVGLALGYGNAFWAESGPESWGGGGHPPLPQAILCRWPFPLGSPARHVEAEAPTRRERMHGNAKMMLVFFSLIPIPAYQSAVCSPHGRQRQVLAAPLPAWPCTLLLRPQDPGSYPPGPMDKVALSGAKPQRGRHQR